MSRAFRIVVLPGDGIGKEVTAEAVKALQAVEKRFAAIRLELEERPAGAQCYVESGSDLPAETWRACRAADAIYLGAMGLPDVRRADGTELAPQLDLRRDLDLYAGVRPVYLFHEAHSPLKGYRAGQIDFVLVRESTEGLFVSRDRGIRVGNEAAVDSLVITRRSTARVVRYAAQIALSRGKRRHLTCVDKANVFGTYAFFRKVFDEALLEYSGVQGSRLYVDAAALYLVRKPEAFDVIVTENMFGDILSDLAAGLVGGMGMAPSADIGNEHAVFQPAHGSAPDIAGQGIANPVAAILSAEMMLDYLAKKHGETQLSEAARAIRRAVESLFAATAKTTPDLGGSMTCAEVGRALCERIAGGA
jgi:3-isopropylmalate dehydrogenase